MHERIHKYFEEKTDGSHLVELWNKVGGGRPGANLRDTSERFLNNLIVNSNERADIYGDMGFSKTLKF